MKKFILFLLAIAAVVFSASTCEKMEPGDYRDFSGAKINLLGSWVLTEVQYKTALMLGDLRIYDAALDDADCQALYAG